MKNAFVVITVFIVCNILVCPFVDAKPPSKPGEDVEKKYLFPGTGFFIKNRDPYSLEVSKDWFLQAVELQSKGESAEALKVFEKFTKRRCDHSILHEGKSILIGPESIYRAAMIREQKGDWKKAFDHLKLIAEAYVLYDFELVAASLTRIAEKLATAELPKKWGFVPQLRSSSDDRDRLNEIVKLSRGPKYAPRALMILAEISLQAEKEEEAIDALSRLVNYYPEHYLSEKAYFVLGEIYEGLVSGPSYDQTSTQEALNYYTDYLYLYSKHPDQGVDESLQQFEDRVKSSAERREQARIRIEQLKEIWGQSYLELGKYVEDYGKYYLIRWEELGTQPARRFYQRVLEVVNTSEAAREAESRLGQLKDE